MDTCKIAAYVDLMLMTSACWQLAQLLERDKEQCQAVVQLLSDRDVAVTLPFDAICEYAADVSVDSFDY